MKQLLFVLVSLIFFTTSYAQEGERMFRKFKGEVSLGYARFASSEDIKNGFGLALEPKFQVLDQLAISARLETILLGKDYTNSGGGKDFKIKFYQSLIAAAEYYFTKDYKIRPFAGAGGGLYTLEATSTSYDYSYDNSNDNGQRKFKFGGMLRAGVEIRHFRIGLEYNFIPNTTATYIDGYTGYQIVEHNKNSYFAFKAGFCFGGGPMKK